MSAQEDCSTCKVDSNLCSAIHTTEETRQQLFDRAYAAGARADRLIEESEYFKDRESVIEMLCAVMWFKPWHEAKESPRRVYTINGLMKHIDDYVDTEQTALLERLDKLMDGDHGNVGYGELANFIDAERERLKARK